MGAQIRVLHVDDEPDITELTKTYLERENDRFSVETATSAAEALSVLEQASVDCVVSDYQMPETNGIEFLETVRDAHPSLPFILFTGRGSEDIASEAMSAGVTNYLTKGRETARYELLGNQIENAVESYRAETRADEMTRRYQALFNQDHNAIVWVEFDGDRPIIQDANPRFEALFAEPGEDLIGRDLDEIVAGENRMEEARELSRQVRAGERFTGELTRETVEGPQRFHWQTIPVDGDESTRVAGAFAVYTALNREIEEIPS